MKKFLHVLLFTLLLAHSPAFSQDVIPNGNFETWDGDPVSWTNPLSFNGVINVVPSNDAHDGEMSAKLFVIWDNNTSMYLPATLNSSIIPVTEQHPSLYGFFKGAGVEGDIFSVTVYIYSINMVIGYGSFFTSDNVTDWTEFSVPITYTSSDTPDNAYIYILVSGQGGLPHDGSEYLVDNLSWDGSAGIGDLQTVTNYSLSPNPAATGYADIRFTLKDSDELRINLITSQGTVIHLSEKEFRPAGENTFHINTGTLPPGIYFVQALGNKYGFIEKLVVQ